MDVWEHDRSLYGQRQIKAIQISRTAECCCMEAVERCQWATELVSCADCFHVSLLSSKQDTGCIPVLALRHGTGPRALN